MKNNQMRINDHIAVINFDPDIGMFRGEFLGLNGGADFYASSVEELQREGMSSLETYLSICRERGIKPNRHFYDRFVASLSPDLHERVAFTAEAAGLSLNQWVQQALDWFAGNKATPSSQQYTWTPPEYMVGDTITFIKDGQVISGECTSVNTTYDNGVARHVYIVTNYHARLNGVRGFRWRVYPNMIVKPS